MNDMIKRRLFLTGLLGLSLTTLACTSHADVNCQQYSGSEVAICNNIQTALEQAKDKFKDYFSSASTNGLALLNQANQSQERQSASPAPSSYPYFSPNSES